MSSRFAMMMPEPGSDPGPEPGHQDVRSRQRRAAEGPACDLEDVVDGQHGCAPAAWWLKALRRLPALLGLLLLGAAAWAVHKEFRHLSVGQIRDSLGDIPRWRLVASAAMTVLSYLVLSFYDRLATIQVGRRIGFRRAAFAAFCSYVLSHNLGFAAISGAAVRFRLYGNWGLKPLEITQIIAFCSVTYLLGACALAGGILLFEPDALPLISGRVPHGLLVALGLLAWGVVGAYVGLSIRLKTLRLFRRTVSLPGLRMSLGQVVVATLEVAATAAIAYVLLPTRPGLDFPVFLAIYIASYSAGLLASVPGGLGVFDGAMVLGLSPFVSAPDAIGVIVVFRLFYYVIPLFLAGLLFAGHELLLRGDSLLARRQGGDAAPRVRPSSVVRESEADFAVTVATGAVSLCGAMLLALGAFTVPPDLSFALPPTVSLFGFENGFGSGVEHVFDVVGDFIPSLVGAALMALAIGLSQRVTLAWGLTLVLLAVAAAMTALTGVSLAVPGALILTALVVAPFRSSYYRHARLLSEPLAPTTVLPLLFLLACVVILARLEPDVRGVGDNGWLQLVLGTGMSARVRLSVGLAVIVALLALARLVWPGRIAGQSWDEDAAARYAALEGAVTGTRWQVDGLMMGETGRAGMPYRRLRRVLVGYGDPAGAAVDRVSTIWRFRDLAVQEGREPAFWRVGPELLDVYADLGLEAWPLESEPGLFLCCSAERGAPLLALLARAG